MCVYIHYCFSSSAQQGCIYMIKNTVKIVKYYCNLKQLFLCECVKLSFISVTQRCIFSIITPVFSVTWSSENHNNMLIWCSRNISDYYQCWKQLCCPISLCKLWHILFFRIHRWIESSKEQHLFETEIFCNMPLTGNFDQFNASLMNKSIYFFKKPTDLKLLCIYSCVYNILDKHSNVPFVDIS